MTLVFIDKASRSAVGFTPLDTSKLTADEPLSGAFGIFAKGGARQVGDQRVDPALGWHFVPPLSCRGWKQVNLIAFSFECSL